MIMAYVPKERLCFGDYASLQFHLVRFADTGKMDLASSLWMLNRYPGNIRDWLMARGGVASMSIQDLWTLEAEELLDMGYRKCEYEPAPLMTKLRITTAPMPSLPLPKSALQQYRPKWETAEEVEIREREHWRKRDEKAEEAYRRWVESRQVWPTIKEKSKQLFLAMASGHAKDGTFYTCQVTEVTENMSGGADTWRHIENPKDAISIFVLDKKNQPPQMMIHHLQGPGKIYKRQEQYATGAHTLSAAGEDWVNYTFYGMRTIGSSVYRIVAELTLKVDETTNVYNERIFKNGNIDAEIEAKCTEGLIPDLNKR
jgi:hypothetical protein